LRSTNNGDSWTQVDSVNSVYALLITSRNHILAGTSTGIILSEDNGDSWTELNAGLPRTSILSLVINFSGYVFAGTSRYGVYRSIQSTTTMPDPPTLVSPANGTTDTIRDPTLVWTTAARAEKYYCWLSTSGDISAPPVFIQETADTSLVATGLAANTTYYWRVWSWNSAGNSQYSSDIWHFTTQSVTSVAEQESLPTTFALDQNYPNPFNPETEISFQLPKSKRIVLRIFNTLGQEIRTLVNAQYEAGYHSVRWDAKDKNGNTVPSGVYLYQLRAGEFAQVKKMSLIR